MKHKYIYEYYFMQQWCKVTKHVANQNQMMLTWSRSGGSLPESVFKGNFGQALSLFLRQVWVTNMTALFSQLETIITKTQKLI